MRLLFEIDRKDYDPDGSAFIRPSARAIILRECTVALVHSLQYDYYKFPGGGIETGEDPREALIREVREEAGLLVLPETIREYGLVRRKQKSDYGGIFIQENSYYFCQTGPQTVSQQLDDYEADARFTLEFVTPETAILANRNSPVSPFEQVMLEREARVLEMLMEEKYL